MVTWFGRHGDTFSMTENAFFSCIYNPQITVSPTSSFSASFNGNRVKNHPIAWTCPLKKNIFCTYTYSTQKQVCTQEITVQGNTVPAVLFSHCHSMQGAVEEGHGFSHLGTIILDTWPSHKVMAVLSSDIWRKFTFETRHKRFSQYTTYASEFKDRHVVSSPEEVCCFSFKCRIIICFKWLFIKHACVYVCAHMQMHVC